MDPITIAAEAVTLINAALNIIAAIKGSSGLTDDQILAAAQATVNTNDKLYTTLKTALGS